MISMTVLPSGTSGMPVDPAESPSSWSASNMAATDSSSPSSAVAGAFSVAGFCAGTFSAGALAAAGLLAGTGVGLFTVGVVSMRTSKSSGPALITLSSDQSDQTGLPEIFLNKGNMRLLFGADGSARLLSRTGRLVDLCARLTA